MVIPVIKFSDKISFVIESMPPKKSAPKPPLKKDAKAEKAEAKKKEAAAKAAKAAAKVAPKVNPAGKKAPAAKPAPPAKPAAGKGGKAKAVAPVIAPAPAPVPAKKDTKRGAKDTGKVVDSGPSKKAKTDADVAKTTAKDDKKDDAVIVKVVTKGGAAVDSLVPNKDNYRVFQEGGKSYSATLNQSNLDGNNNKFYIIQILQNEKTNAIFVWNRWGRVGVPGQNALKGPFLKDGAIREFNSKHHEKTVKGDYIELDIKYDDDGDDKKKDDGKKKVLKTGTSKLDKNVQDLLNLIFDTNIMNNTMKEIGYDAKKMPLGKLGESTIKEAYKVLNSLSGAIKKKDHQQIKSLSGQFYSLIPHDFGFQKMINFILDTEEKVKQKLDMLAAISDMKITTKILENQNSDEDVIDQNYKKLGCKIASVDKNSKEFKVISDYLHNTKESWKIDIDAIYKIEREEDEKKFNKKVGNNMLLWHGSRIANFVGILSQGLRIAPPEAPVSGYLFGKGIYLADMIDKSAHYCRSWGSDKALCLLVEGAIGNPNILLNSSYEAKEQMEKAKKDSTKCHGSKAPPPESYVKLDSYQVPVGKAKPTNSGSWMGHNEYIVYNVSQAKIRYVVKMKMG